MNIEINRSAQNMRINTIKLAHNAGNLGAHVGPSLSIIDILATLYKSILKYDISNTLWENRDRFILSKGHGALALYTALAEAKIISNDLLYTFENDGGPLSGQPVRNINYGIEFSSGSLGMGLSIGVGVAHALKMKNIDSKVFVLMGNGECNEGSVWESAMSASQMKLGNLIAIIDDNKMQSDGNSKDVLDMGNWLKKWDSFGFETYQVNGHDTAELESVFGKCSNAVNGKPKMVIADTVKGYGVSHFENNPDWHHGIITKELCETALDEILKKPLG